MSQRVGRDAAVKRSLWEFFRATTPRSRRRGASSSGAVDVVTRLQATFFARETSPVRRQISTSITTRGLG